MANLKSSRRTFPRTCVCCGSKSVQPALIDREFDVKHDGKQYTVSVRDLEVERCESCGEVTLGVDADDRIDASLREQLGFLTPAQIRRNRKVLGLTQTQLAESIGCASETLSRWENGAIVQSRGADRLLRAYFALPSLRTFLATVELDPTLGACVIEQVQWTTVETSMSDDLLTRISPLPQSPSRSFASNTTRRINQHRHGELSSNPSEYPRRVNYDEAA